MNYLPIALSVMSALTKSGSKTVTQEAMLTDEQKKALQGLLDYARTGSYGGYTAGETYSGALGNYDLTDLEKAGQTNLSNLLSTPVESVNYGTYGQEKLKELLDGDKYDPYSETGTFSGFKKSVLRQGQESQDALKRNMAMSGNLYSTATAKESGLLQERVNDQLTNKLAELYENYTNKKTNAIPYALQSDQSQANFALNKQNQEENINMGRISASQQYGATERLLKDTAAKDAYSEWVRANNNKATQIDALKRVLNSNVNYGAKNMSIPTTSPWSDVLNMLSGMYGQSMVGQQG